jgi:hypothetical protein
VTSRRRYLSLLAVGLAGCSFGQNSDDDGSTDGSGGGDGTPTDDDTDGGSDATPTGTPQGDVSTIEVDDPAVAWAVRMPRAVSWAPAADAEAGRVFVPMGRSTIGTPDESSNSPGGTIVGLADGDGSEDWRTGFDAPVASDLSVSGGTLDVVTGYSTGTDGVQQQVHALGADGSEQWATEAREAWLSVVAQDGDTTFVATGDDAVDRGGETLMALGSDGSVSWEVDAGDATAAAVADDLLLYSNGGLELAAFGRSDGSEAWTAAGRPLGNGATDIANAGGMAFTQAEEEGENGYPFVAHSLDDGSEQWTYSVAVDGDNFVPTGAASLADVDGSAAVVGVEAGGTVFALDANGAEKWQVEIGSQLASGGPLVGDAVYVTTADGTVVALDPASGEERWTSAFDREIHTRLADSGLFVYSGRNRGRVATALGADGEAAWEFELPSGVNAASVAGDRLYVVVEGKSVYALDFGGN